MTGVVVPAPTGAGADRHRRLRTTTRTVLIAAWAVPVLVIGQFAMLAVIPVALAQTATIRHAGLRPLRPWTAALTAAYASALILWAAGPDRAPSLSKDMHPVSATLIVAAALATIVAVHVERRRSRVRGGPRPAHPLVGTERKPAGGHGPTVRSVTTGRWIRSRGRRPAARRG